MKFSLALTSLLLGALVTPGDADGPVDWVRERLEDRLALNGMEESEQANRRRLSFLNEDFSEFVGTWHSCMQTSLMTFGGENAPKHVVEQVGCEAGALGNVTRVGDNDQSMQMDVFILNHCFFWDLGGPGQPPCPDDLLESDDRGPGNVLVKYQYFGIGSFADPGKIRMVSDHTFIRNEEGEWTASHDRAKLENKDTMDCQVYGDGIVCDWRINEYRTSSELKPKGCVLDGECTQDGFGACAGLGGVWSRECNKIKYTPDGFVYDSFGSYYLVQDMADCDVECATDAPTVTGQTRSPELRTEGCYQGGVCNGSHGCCDCSMTEDECTLGTWLLDCGDICEYADPSEDPPGPVTGCYYGGACDGIHGCCDCDIPESECTDGGIWLDGCEGICFEA